MASRQEEKEARRQARHRAGGGGAQVRLAQQAPPDALRRRARRSASSRRSPSCFRVGGDGGSESETGGQGAHEQPASSCPPSRSPTRRRRPRPPAASSPTRADEGRGHEEKTFTAADYKTNPPTSGTHFPTWAQDGIYAPANTPPLGELVHTSSTARINVQYKPGTSKEVVAQLEELLAESDAGYHMLLYQNPTEMDCAVAATAWDDSLTCPEMNDKVFDAIRTFRQAHIDRGPEKVA